jgi:hypothetical protein
MEFLEPLRPTLDVVDAVTEPGFTVLAVLLSIPSYSSL